MARRKTAPISDERLRERIEIIISAGCGIPEPVEVRSRKLVELFHEHTRDLAAAGDRLAEALRRAEPQGCQCCDGVGADHSCDERHESEGRDPEAGWHCFPCRGRGEVYALPVADRDSALGGRA